MAGIERPKALKLLRTEAEQKLTERILLGEQMVTAGTSDPIWHTYNKQMLNLMFDTKFFENSYTWAGVPHPTHFATSSTPPQPEPSPEKLLRARINELISIRSQLDLFPEPASQQKGASKKLPARQEIFIVHGHASGTKEMVARFVGGLVGRDPLILHELSSGGRTVIEKLEHYSKDVGFAIILLTKDDKGTPINSTTEEELKPRARQNVILELGYFLGSLGRKNVCALYEEGVELPSDYDGVIYIPLDAHDGWRAKLARELDAAEYPINGSQLIR